MDQLHSPRELRECLHQHHRELESEQRLHARQENAGLREHLDDPVLERGVFHGVLRFLFLLAIGPFFCGAGW